MKTTIIDILNKIANGEQPPKLILFKDRQWNYDEKEKDYVNIFNEWLFDSHVISNIVNCEVEILETTITITPKEDFFNNLEKTLNQGKKIEKIDIDITEEAQLGINAKIIYKINEIIEVLNER